DFAVADVASYAGGGSDGADFAAADGDDRAALLFAVVDEPAVAGVVCAEDGVGRALPVVCAVELWVHAGAGEFSVSGGAAVGYSATGFFVERRVCGVCA